MAEVSWGTVATGSSVHDVCNKRLGTKKRPRVGVVVRGRIKCSIWSHACKSVGGSNVHLQSATKLIAAFPEARDFDGLYSGATAVAPSGWLAPFDWLPPGHCPY